MSNLYSVAPATADDISVLADLLEALFSQEEEFKPDREAQVRGLVKIIKNPQIGHILVARQGANIAGMVNLLYTVSTALGSRVALLEDVVISPASRGSGIGSFLLQHAVQFARSQGCKRITLLTDRANDAAQRFYQKHGFTTSPMIPLRISLVE